MNTIVSFTEVSLESELKLFLFGLVWGDIAGAAACAAIWCKISQDACVLHFRFWLYDQYVVYGVHARSLKQPSESSYNPSIKTVPERNQQGK